jgi:hypothetical protein
MYLRVFRFDFSKIQNLCKMHFKIEGAYASMFQNTTPNSNQLLGAYAPLYSVFSELLVVSLSIYA